MSSCCERLPWSSCWWVILHFGLKNADDVQVATSAVHHALCSLACAVRICWAFQRLRCFLGVRLVKEMFRVSIKLVSWRIKGGGQIRCRRHGGSVQRNSQSFNVEGNCGAQRYCVISETFSLVFHRFYLQVESFIPLTILENFIGFIVYWDIEDVVEKTTTAEVETSAAWATTVFYTSRDPWVSISRPGSWIIEVSLMFAHFSSTQKHECAQRFESTTRWIMFRVNETSSLTHVNCSPPHRKCSSWISDCFLERRAQAAVCSKLLS